jgi:hypothetical protein
MTTPTATKRDLPTICGKCGSRHLMIDPTFGSDLDAVEISCLKCGWRPTRAITDADRMANARFLPSKDERRRKGGA